MDHLIDAVTTLVDPNVTSPWLPRRLPPVHRCDSFGVPRRRRRGFVAFSVARRANGYR